MNTFLEIVGIVGFVVFALGMGMGAPVAITGPAVLAGIVAIGVGEAI